MVTTFAREFPPACRASSSWKTTNKATPRPRRPTPFGGSPPPSSVPWPRFMALTMSAAIPAGARSSPVAEDQEQDQQEQENAANAEPAAGAITAVAVTTAAKQEDDQHNKDDRTHRRLPTSEGRMRPTAKQSLVASASSASPFLPAYLLPAIRFPVYGFATRH